MKTSIKFLRAWMSYANAIYPYHVPYRSIGKPLLAIFADGNQVDSLLVYNINIVCNGTCSANNVYVYLIFVVWQRSKPRQDCKEKKKKNKSYLFY